MPSVALMAWVALMVWVVLVASRRYGGTEVWKIRWRIVVWSEKKSREKQRRAKKSKKRFGGRSSWRRGPIYSSSGVERKRKIFLGMMHDKSVSTPPRLVRTIPVGKLQSKISSFALAPRPEETDVSSIASG